LGDGEKERDTENESEICFRAELFKKNRTGTAVGGAKEIMKRIFKV
jgi:hypothetical protein